MELKIIPIVSEKSYAQAQRGMYVFNVPLTATKLAIKRAVAAQYNVTVEGFTTLITNGKVKRTFRKGGSYIKGTRNDSKKAYVRLGEGQSIPVFPEAEKAKPAKSEEKK